MRWQHQMVVNISLSSVLLLADVLNGVDCTGAFEYVSTVSRSITKWKHSVLYTHISIDDRVAAFRFAQKPYNETWKLRKRAYYHHRWTYALLSLLGFSISSWTGPNLLLVLYTVAASLYSRKLTIRQSNFNCWLPPSSTLNILALLILWKNLPIIWFKANKAESWSLI